MACKECKKNKTLKDQILTGSTTFEKVTIVILVILFVLAGYGAYSLVQNVL